MSTICISPLRIAFDHIGVRKVYEKSIRMAADNQITSLSNYMLYNFMDTPTDLYQRMRLNIDLNEELGDPNLVIPDALPARDTEGPVARGQEVEPVLPPFIPNHAPGDKRSSKRQSVVLLACIR